MPLPANTGRMETRPIPDHGAWDAWQPAELALRLSGIAKPWCVVGGWALDLWHGEKTRDHEDLEFTVLRGDVAMFRAALGDMDFYAVGSGVVSPLPSDATPPAGIAQIWCHDRAAGCWRVDMMIEEGTADRWVYKRDPSIAFPRAEMIATTADGIPYLRPAGVLLFKAKYLRDKDEIDFANALPKLAPSERDWLRAMLGQAHPGHAWQERL
ncbi:nucleotidyltransferase domain-containing protein [Rhizobium sp.]|uniref:nucleotidyltransferase domain-containing protein n=1 Tax=Rhizobium sp. TaxID=391 RepID=UPI000DB9BCF7